MDDDRSTAREKLFWDLAAVLHGDPGVTRSTMMGFPCLRVDGNFFASLERGTNHLIVKLSRQRVTALVEGGVGLPFAPNGRVFREWVAIPEGDEDLWRRLLIDAKRFASS